MPPKKKQAVVEEDQQTQEIKVKEVTKTQVQTVLAPIKTGSHPFGKLGDGKFQSDKVVISSWNINGIRAVLGKGQLVDYIKSKNPDIICLNETKVDEDTIAKDKINSNFPSEYQQFWNSCKNQKGYAGTAIFSKVAPISVQYDIGVKEHDQEGRTITLEFEKFYLVACYVPNAGQGLKRIDYRVKRWDQDFQRFLNDLKKKKHTILCGDLNVCHHEIDIAKPKGNEKSAGFTKEERAEFTKFLNQGWIDTFRHLYPKEVKYSYFNARSDARKQNIGWRLDYFVIDSPAINAVEDSQINQTVYGSDHVPLELTLKINQL